MLDDHLIHKERTEKEIRKWWTRKFLLYNIIIGFFGVLVITLEAILLERAAAWWLKLLPEIFSFGIMVNLGLYVLQRGELYLFQSHSKQYSTDLVNALFWMGTGLSVLIVCWAEFEVLYKANYFPSLTSLGLI